MQTSILLLLIAFLPSIALATSAPTDSPSVSPTASPSVSPTELICSMGRFKNGTECSSCPVDTFGNVTGLEDACYPCNEGYTTFGATESITCYLNVTCAPGRFNNGTACEPCPVDTFSDSFGAVECTPCPSNKTTYDTFGSIACDDIVCQPGLYYNGTSCDNCAVDTYTATVAFNEECTPCPNGTSTTGLTGMSSCTPDVVTTSAPTIKRTCGCEQLSRRLI